MLSRKQMSCKPWMKENEEHNLTVVTAKASFNRKTKHVLITKLSVMKLARISSVVNTSRTSSPDLSRNSWRLVSHKGAKSATKLENEWKDHEERLKPLVFPRYYFTVVWEELPATHAISFLPPRIRSTIVQFWSSFNNSRRTPSSDVNILNYFILLWVQTSWISQILTETLVTNHSHHGYEDDYSKSSINKVSVSSDVGMTSLIKLHYTQARDNVHERGICMEKQYNFCNVARIIIALPNTESGTGVK